MTKESSITDIAHQLERVPERVETARKALDDWTGALTKAVQKSPGQTLLGAFAAGFLLAKVGRYL